MLRINTKLLHKKLNPCLLRVQGDLDLCGSMYESHDDARFAREGKYNECSACRGRGDTDAADDLEWL